MKPIKLQQYKCSWKHREVIEEQIIELLEAGLIRPTQTTKWAHPVLLVSKPRSDKLRLCCDVRKLNNHGRTITYPTLDIPNVLADIGSKKCKYFSCIDLKAAYNQIPLSKRSQEICAFTFTSVNFSLTTAIFGLKNLHI